jgi:hypothetical protein
LHQGEKRGKKENCITSSLNPPPIGSQKKIIFSKCFFLNRNDTFDDIPKTDVPMTPAPQKKQPNKPNPKHPHPKRAPKKKKRKERKKERKREKERERGPH